MPTAVAQAFTDAARAHTFRLAPSGLFSREAAQALDTLACDAFERYAGVVTVREIAGEGESASGVRVCGYVDALEYGTPTRYAIDLRAELRACPIDTSARERVPRVHVSMGWRKLGRGDAPDGGRT